MDARKELAFDVVCRTVLFLVTEPTHTLCHPHRRLHSRRRWSRPVETGDTPLLEPPLMDRRVQSDFRDVLHQSVPTCGRRILHETRATPTAISRLRDLDDDRPSRESDSNEHPRILVAH